MRSITLVDVIDRETLLKELLGLDVIFFTDREHGRREHYQSILNILTALKDKGPAMYGKFCTELFSPQQNHDLALLSGGDEAVWERLKACIRDFYFESTIRPFLERMHQLGFSVAGIGSESFEDSCVSIPHSNGILTEEIKEHIPAEGKLVINVGVDHAKDAPYNDHSVPYRLKELFTSLRIGIMDPGEFGRDHLSKTITPHYCIYSGNGKP